ncbi:hypothetical protein [Kitasatospora sp. MAP5-34]|uniref:hypothetical protein n=1 Tax=Kitasatospora sp. MAP5-34 TaxID=3035102 RepID=UPI002476F967|nr:hypothetical protein [Kitasatospora sp. MAP5-34]MDH6578530.1 hypothetical protein [Kitasatospora sp. MAP5-34]
MASAPPASRPRWDHVPEPVRDAVESRQGAPVGGIDYPGGGFTPGIAARLTFADGTRVFVKGITLDDPTARHYEVEAAVGPYLPHTVAPALLWSIRTAGWLLNGYEDLPGTMPALSPTSRDLLPRVVHPLPAAAGRLVGGPGWRGRGARGQGVVMSERRDRRRLHARARALGIPVEQVDRRAAPRHRPVRPLPEPAWPRTELPDRDDTRVTTQPVRSASPAFCCPITHDRQVLDGGTVMLLTRHTAGCPVWSAR